MFKRLNNYAATILPGLKTRLFNGVLAVASGLLVVLQMFDVIDVRNYISDPKIGGYVMLGVTVLNYWLRYITTIEVKKDLV